MRWSHWYMAMTGDFRGGWQNEMVIPWILHEWYIVMMVGSADM